MLKNQTLSDNYVQPNPTQLYKKNSYGGFLKPNKTETMKFCGCRDWDSLRLENSVGVETETHQDWGILWLLRPRLIQTTKFVVVETETKQNMRKLVYL